MLEVAFEKFFHSYMYNYIGKLRIIKWNRFDTDCKNEFAMFTAGLASQIFYK